MVYSDDARRGSRLEHGRGGRDAQNKTSWFFKFHPKRCKAGFMTSVGATAVTSSNCRGREGQCSRRLGARETWECSSTSEVKVATLVAQPTPPHPSVNMLHAASDTPIVPTWFSVSRYSRSAFCVCVVRAPITLVVAIVVVVVAVCCCCWRCSLHLSAATTCRRFHSQKP